MVYVKIAANGHTHYIPEDAFKTSPVTTWHKVPDLVGEISSYSDDRLHNAMHGLIKDLQFMLRPYVGENNVDADGSLYGVPEVVFGSDMQDVSPSEIYTAEIKTPIRLKKHSGLMAELRSRIDKAVVAGNDLSDQRVLWGVRRNPEIGAFIIVATMRNKKIKISTMKERCDLVASLYGVKLPWFDPTDSTSTAMSDGAGGKLSVEGWSEIYAVKRMLTTK